MPAMSLNHYTILARDLEATKNFYTDSSACPSAIVRRSRFRLLAVLRRRADGAPDRPPRGGRADHRRAGDPAKTGRLDHIAFSCEGLKGMKANLEQHGIKYDERVLPRLNMTQLFYYDPDGIAVECNFAAHETPAQ